jgi:hypothetical protein
MAAACAITGKATRALQDMAAAGAAKMPTQTALFVDDDELRRRINPRMGRDRFRAAVRDAETRGFPNINTIWKGRYWPAVKAWPDEESRIRNHGTVAIADDGPEHFDAPAEQDARPEIRTQSAPLLGGKASRPRSARFSRPLHSAAARG